MKKISLFAMLFICFGWTSLQTVEATEKDRSEYIEIVDMSAYIGKPIKISVKGGIIDSAYRVENGIVNESKNYYPYSSYKGYTDVHMDGELTLGGFSGDEPKIAFKILASTTDYSIHIETGAKEDPFDFTNYLLEKGNIINIKQKNDGENGTYSKVHFQAGESYFIEGSAQNFKILDPSGNEFYTNLMEKDIDGELKKRSNLSIGATIRPTLSGDYLVVNESGNSRPSSLSISIYQMHSPSTSEIELNIMSPNQSIKKAYAMEITDSNAQHMQIRNDREYVSNELALAFVYYSIFYEPEKTHNSGYTQDYIGRVDLSSKDNRIFSNHHVIENFYSIKENKKVLIAEFSYALKSIFSENLKLYASGKSFDSVIGRETKEAVKEKNAEDRSDSELADPVDVFKGNFVDRRMLLSYGGPNPLELSMSYDSIANDSISLSGGFTHNFETYLTENEDDIAIYLDPNKKIIFTNGSDGYSTKHSKNKQMSLQKIGEQYQFVKEQEVFLFNVNGQILSRQDKAGVITSYTYDENLLTKVQNNKGQTFEFIYTNGKLTSVTDAGDRIVTFNYNSDKSLLTSIVFPNRSVFKIGYINTLTSANQDNKVASLELDNIILVKNVYNDLGAIKQQSDGNASVTIFDYDEITNEDQIVATVTEPDGYRLVKAHDLEGNVLFDVDKEGNKTTYSYDNENRKTEEIDPLGNKEQYEYNELNLISRIIFPDLSETLFDYDSDANITKITTEDGLDTKHMYEDNHLVDTVNKNGTVTKYIYNNFGEVLTIIEGEKRSTYEYDENGYLIETVDKAGNKIAFENDDLGRTIKTTFPNETFVTQEYDKHNNIVRITSADGNETVFEYNVFGDKTKEIDSQGKVTTFEYDKNGNLLKEVKENRGFSHTYDKMNRLISTSRTGISSSYNKVYKYTANGWLSKIETESDVVTNYLYDANGNILEEKTGEIKKSYKYDNRNRILSTKDGKGNETVYVRNVIGQIIKEISPSGNTKSFTYDGIGNLLTIKDGNGFVTSHIYDQYNNLIQTKDPLNNITKFKYNANNQLIKTKNSLEEVVVNEYNELGQLVTLKNALGETVYTYDYDKNGNVIKITNGNNHSLSFVYDSSGNLIEQYDGTNNRISFNTYNSFGDLLETADILGFAEKWTYSVAGVPSSNTSKLGNTTLLEYSPNGLLKKSTNPLKVSHAQSYTTSGLLASVRITSSSDLNYYYNENGQLIQESNPNKNNVFYAYNNEQEMIEHTNARSQSTSYTYDKNGNVIQSVSPEMTVNYSYDALNRLIGSTSLDETTNYKYDSLGRVIKKIQNGQSVSYVYDERGHLTEMNYPNGKSVFYTYDVMGNMLSVKDWNNQLTTYTYDENNLLVQTNHANGVIEDRTYDAAGQLIELESKQNGTVITHYKYTYDASGNILTEESVAKGTTLHYTYDGLERLTTSNQNKYTYDNFGNITKVEKNLTDEIKTSIFSYGKDNELTRIGNEYTSLDKDGNLLTYKLNGKTYIASYDSGNYLTNYEKTSYAYDHEGNRTKIIDEESQTDLFVDTVSSKYSQVLQETTNGKSIYYIYGNGLIGHYDETNAYTTYHYDSRGSTVATTDASGIVTGEAAYDEYGVILSNTVNSRFLYNGQYGVETDDNGLYYMRARYYNPELKRFMNRDVIAGSIENNQTLNRYAYTNGNPISFIDPFGLARETSKWSKWGHVAFDIGGAFPVVGEVLDAANAVWYLAEGDYENAAYSAAAMTPLGTIATVTKYGKKAKNVLADNSGYVKLDLQTFSNKEYDIEIAMPRYKYPESAKHIEDAINSGHPKILTISRNMAKERRKESLKGILKVKGKDLDEYPFAMTEEGGKGASIRPISPSDNRGSGSYLGHQLRKHPNGTKFKIKIE